MLIIAAFPSQRLTLTIRLLKCCCLAFAFHAQVVAYLLERGADVEAKDSTLVTPMHCAAAGGNIDCCKLLFTKGAVVSARDDKVMLCLLLVLLCIRACPV
jgi:ankyrin repeat protein